MSDHTMKNKMGETALDSAKAAQEAYDKSTFNFPKFSTSVSTEEDLATSRHGMVGRAGKRSYDCSTALAASVDKPH